MRSMLLAMQSEEFSIDHTSVMGGDVRVACLNLAEKAGDLLCRITLSATDGTFDAIEKGEIDLKIKETKAMVEALARTFDTARKRAGTPLNDKLQGECFFVICLSAYARLVME